MVMATSFSQTVMNNNLWTVHERHDEVHEFTLNWQTQQVQTRNASEKRMTTAYETMALSSPVHEETDIEGVSATGVFHVSLTDSAEEIGIDRS